jgi:DNA-binding NarL/FixJ family response regulator
MDILLAIDSADLRLAIDLLFREEPAIRVTGVVRDANTLLALIKTKPVQLIVLEINLPGMPLIDLLHQIKQLTPAPRLLLLGDPDHDETTKINPYVDAIHQPELPPARLLETVYAVTTHAENN